MFEYFFFLEFIQKSMITSPGKWDPHFFYRGNQSFLTLFMSSSECIPKPVMAGPPHSGCGHCFVNHQDSEFIGWKIGSWQESIVHQWYVTCLTKLSWQHYILSFKNLDPRRQFEGRTREKRSWSSETGTGLMEQQAQESKYPRHSW